MERKIERQFVEDRASIIDTLPLTWSIRQAGPHYCITMKMSRLKDLTFGFEFGPSNHRQQFPVTQYPERVVKLDVSLNELEELKVGSLLPFKNLSELDASLNALDNIEGVSVLHSLAVLNLNYNALTSTKGLESCKSLTVLNLSHNQVKTIRDLPLLSNLTHLHLDSNKGNPLARDNRYVTAIAQSTSVEILDNFLLKNPSKSLLLSVDKSLLLSDPMQGFPKGGQMKEHLKESARESFMEKLQRKRKDVEGTIHHLHNRILDLQEELKEYEENLGAEMEGCIRYIDTIPPEDFHSIDPQKVPRAMEQYLFTKFWERWELGQRRPRDMPFKDLTKPEEVRNALSNCLL
ncbi:hypothetical protein NDU88_003222 [Pleurodeles waltl]|uniref:Uncharacterized protein n=1 Tax=Pleurodeles waltl TaxID=8319 RepID=A0AAV7SF14_PLEWA|nr:hypothetical protein NDU88_003222 [Pleurodeles waltl]